MDKSISFEYEGREYVLCFTRRTVEKLEKLGFESNAVDTKMMTMLPLFFWGSFLAKQPFVKKELTDEVLLKFKNKEALYEKLSELYNEPMSSLIDDPADEGNAIAWEANF